MEEKAEMCVVDVKDISGNESETCQMCQLSIVNVSCIVIIPEGEQPTSNEEIAGTIEEFASKELPG